MIVLLFLRTFVSFSLEFFLSDFPFPKSNQFRIGMVPSLFFTNSNELELSILELERVEFSPSNSNRTEPSRTFELLKRFCLLCRFEPQNFADFFSIFFWKKWRKVRTFFKKIYKKWKFPAHELGLELRT